MNDAKQRTSKGTQITRSFPRSYFLKIYKKGHQREIPRYSNFPSMQETRLI